jgi:hypothetical protein
MTGTAPHLDLAFLCEAASESGTHLNALGIGINLVSVAQLPAMHHMTLVLRVRWFDEIPEGDNELSVRFLGPSDDPLVQIGGSFKTQSERSRHPELAISANMVFPVPIPLKEYGLHKVEIGVAGQMFAPLHFKVVRPGE